MGELASLPVEAEAMFLITHAPLCSEIFLCRRLHQLLSTVCKPTLVPVGTETFLSKGFTHLGLVLLARFSLICFFRQLQNFLFPLLAALVLGRYRGLFSL
jgi:hypothetical protein